MAGQSDKPKMIFSLAVSGGVIVGFISLYWRWLPPACGGRLPDCSGAGVWIANAVLRD